MLNIALNTFRELARNRILTLIFLFAAALILFSLALASLSMGQTEKITIDFGLSMIEIFWLISVIFIGSQLIFKEIDGKTIYLILSKPISRHEFILGKFFWFSMILFCIVFFQSIIFLLLLLFSRHEVTLLIVWSLFFIYLKLTILFAIILFFSTFISSMLSIILTIMVYVIAHGITSIIDMAVHTKSYLMMNLGKIAYVIFPPFEALNIKDVLLSQVTIGPGEYALNLLYSVLYVIILLGFSIMIFNTKTFES